MIDIILNKVVDSLDNNPEYWVMCEYDDVKYASRHVEESDTFIEVFEDRIEHLSSILYIPENLRWKVKEAIERFVAKELSYEQSIAEKDIYKVVSGW